jgi:hypothetical protein
MPHIDLILKITWLKVFINLLKKLSPCNGWMTTNATVRQMTTDYAMLLSGLIKNVTITHQYKNFDMLYTDLPIDKSKSLKIELYLFLNALKILNVILYSLKSI